MLGLLDDQFSSYKSKSNYNQMKIYYLEVSKNSTEKLTRYPTHQAKHTSKK